MLWLYVGLVVSSIVAAFYPDYSQNLAAAYEAEPTTWLFGDSWLALAALASLFLIFVVGLVGLFNFKAWARALSLYSTLASLLLFPFAGPSLFGGLESTLGEAAAMLWGAILALSYFSPVSNRFGR